MSYLLAVPLSAWAGMLLYGAVQPGASGWSYPRWLATAGVAGLAVAGGELAWRVHGHWRRDRELRRDLRGVVLELDHHGTLALLPGEDATLRVDSVRGTDDPDFVLVAGAWCGPDGDDVHARVEVRASALPRVAAR